MELYLSELHELRRNNQKSFMKNFGKSTNNTSLATSRDETVNIRFEHDVDGYLMHMCTHQAVPVPSPVSRLKGAEPYDFEKMV